MYSHSKKFFLPAVFIVLAVLVTAVLVVKNRSSSTSEATNQAVSVSNEPNSPEVTAPTENYSGKEEVVANAFRIKIPNGWKASISDSNSFRAIMFARPEQLSALTYSAEVAPTIDRAGIPAWSGLTEHFFVLAPTASGRFSSTDYREVTSEKFTFNDGTVGTKYSVVLHSDEAVQYGGLLRESEWQGRTYIYEANGTYVEAHLALYPSSTIDKVFYESVIQTIQVI